MMKKELNRKCETRHMKQWGKKTVKLYKSTNTGGRVWI